MLPTHALVGMALAMSVAVVVPEFSGVAIAAGLLGGIFPDLDMYVGHRKSLHYPVYYSTLAVPILAVVTLFPSNVTVFLSVFFVGAAAHSVSDIIGGGLELRPWEATSDRGVYSHYHNRWIAPRHWVRYDGSPGDLLLSVSLAIPLLIALDGLLHRIVLVILTVAIVYTAVRRLLPTLAAALVQDLLEPRLPSHLLEYVPTRYRTQ